VNESQADALYAYLRGYLHEWARSPSQREMAEHMRVSRETLAGLLRTLEAQRRAIYRRGRPRQVWVKGAR
jgi:DNA-binding FadR family transcriptional regulator